MNSKRVFIIGLFISVFYIAMVLYLNESNTKKHYAKFAFHLDKKRVEVVALFNKSDKNSTIVQFINNICHIEKCEKHINFKKDILTPKWLKSVSELMKYVNDYNLSKATIVAHDKVEIDFLVYDKKELDVLENISNKYSFIKNNSSVLEVFSINKIENQLNKILSNSTFVIQKKYINFKDRRILNTIFRRLKELGRCDVILNINISDDKKEVLKKFIKNNYPWIRNIEIKQKKINKIKIKEVVS